MPSPSLVAPLFTGPLDIVGDIHGELDALLALLTRLGYAPDGTHPDGRRLVFVGDLGDRGHDSPGVIELVWSLVQRGQAPPTRPPTEGRGGSAPTDRGSWRKRSGEVGPQRAAQADRAFREGFPATIGDHAAAMGGHAATARAGWHALGAEGDGVDDGSAGGDGHLGRAGDRDEGEVA